MISHMFKKGGERDGGINGFWKINKNREEWKSTVRTFLCGGVLVQYFNLPKLPSIL